VPSALEERKKFPKRKGFSFKLNSERCFTPYTVITLLPTLMMEELLDTGFDGSHH